MIMSKIRELRIGANISTEQALEQLNISYSMLNKIERIDRFPSSQLIVKMSKLYGCSIDEIYRALQKIN